MNKLILSAFADEYDDNLIKQCAALNKLGIEYIELRGVNGKKDTFITLEPHLQTFSGFNALVGKSFDNPYKYENREAAFLDAVKKLKELL